MPSNCSTRKMGHSHGYRSGTRYAFSRAHREHGVHLGLSRYLRPLRVGDYVDLAVNGAFHKGMPHKTYHGRTGIVYTVTRRAVGVELNKQVRNRIEKKRIAVRVEHVHPSKCRSDFLERVARVDQLKRDAKKAGKRLPIEDIKRFPVGPRKGAFVPAVVGDVAPELVKPVPFDDMM